jgi:hypothetical protein
MSKRNRKLTTWRTMESGMYLPHEQEYIEHIAFEEKAGPAGALWLYKYPDGQPEDAELLDQGHNLITTTGRSSLAFLQRDTVAAIGAAGVYDLGYLALGNGSTAGALTPVAATTALFNETTTVAGLATRKALSVSTPPPGPPYMTNLWSAQIGPAEYNSTTLDGGVQINIVNEAALFCLNGSADSTGTMFSMRTFANQFKSAGITFEFRWSIIF